MTIAKPIYEDRVLAFIDILGFKTLVHRLAVEPGLHALVFKALSTLNTKYEAAGSPLTSLTVSAFSDSVVISATPDRTKAVLWAASHLQLSLLELGIPVRGGLTRGRAVHTNGIIYGEGLLEAHHLETSAAIYPRIVLSPNLADDLDADFRDAFLRQDTDGLWFIDPFALGLLPGGAEELAADGYDPYEVALLDLGRTIDHELSRLSDAGHIAKWNWLKHQQMFAVREIRESGIPRFEQFLSKSDRRKTVPRQASTSSAKQ